MSAHEHEWRRLAHVDGCHYYAWTFTCECGATRETWAERDVGYDSYSAVWMDPEGREPCVRCEQLLAGAEPERRDEVLLAGVGDEKETNQ